MSGAGDFKDPAPNPPPAAAAAAEATMDLQFRRIVIKLGTHTLCDPDGMPDRTLMSALATQLHELRQRGHQFLIISSGAIGFGRAALRLPDVSDVATRQACAAAGQHRLVSAWDEALGRQKIRAAQILVSADTFCNRRTYVHLRDCVETLLKHGAVPIINENDSTCTDEINDAFGDNDALGATVATKMDADLYVILSDVAGLFDRPPHEPGAQVVRHVNRVTDELLGMARDGSHGGMGSKLESARTLSAAGVPVAIAYGRQERILQDLLDDEPPGTWIDAQPALDAPTQGTIDIDAGALKALQEGFQLLPAGITGVAGEFPVESPIEIRHDGKTVGRAISMLSSHDLNHCKGMQSSNACATLGIEGDAHVTRKGRIVLEEAAAAG